MYAVVFPITKRIKITMSIIDKKKMIKNKKNLKKINTFINLQFYKFFNLKKYKRKYTKLQIKTKIKKIFKSFIKSKIFPSEKILLQRRDFTIMGNNPQIVFKLTNINMFLTYSEKRIKKPNNINSKKHKKLKPLFSKIVYSKTIFQKSVGTLKLIYPKLPRRRWIKFSKKVLKRFFKRLYKKLYRKNKKMFEEKKKKTLQLRFEHYTKGFNKTKVLYVKNNKKYYYLKTCLQKNLKKKRFTTNISNKKKRLFLKVFKSQKVIVPKPILYLPFFLILNIIRPNVKWQRRALKRKFLKRAKLFFKKLKYKLTRYNQKVEIKKFFFRVKTKCFNGCQSYKKVKKKRRSKKQTKRLGRHKKIFRLKV